MKMNKETLKRKRESDDVPLKPFCIVHVNGLKYSKLHMLSNDKDSLVKLERLQEIKNVRLAQPLGSCHRMQESCNLIPTAYDDSHGFHWECYKRFTMNLDRLQQPTNDVGVENPRRSLRNASNDSKLFNPDCIFCNSEARKKVKVKGTWTTQCMSEFEYDGWKSVIEMAGKKHDEKLLSRIQGRKFFESKAKFHKNCRINYMQSADKWRSSDAMAKQQQLDVEKAHSEAFMVVCDKVEREVVIEQNVLRLSDLREAYVTVLATLDCESPNYRSNKLKLKLEQCQRFQGKLSFCELGKFQTYIIYSSEISTQTAMKLVYQLASVESIENLGSQIHKTICKGFSRAPITKWPPMPHDLPNPNDILPEDLMKLLCLIITGKESPSSARQQRLLVSLGQDICRASTNGSWKLPKHVQMALSLRHLYRSEKLITLLNRLGHCESYSFSLELETALAAEAIESSSQLSNKIVRSPKGPSVFHSEFDNFDCLINDLTGKGSIHTAHGIMLQEIQDDQEPQNSTEVLSQVRNHKRSLCLTQDCVLPDCYISNRQSPKLIVNSLECTDAKNAQAVTLEKQNLWILTRLLEESNQSVPAWAGFISKTGSTLKKLTTVDYYPVINQPITEYKTVQECLRAAEEATNEVGQHYVITTFDLGVCMKAFPIVWNSGERYKNHIILIGTFHLLCAYMRAIGKKMAGSGLEEVFLEAGLIGSGSLSGVMSGKHYDRALHCHIVILESLERLLVDQFLIESGATDLASLLPRESLDSLAGLSQQLDKDTLADVSANPNVITVLSSLTRFRSAVKAGKLGKTAQFWLSYMDHVRLVLQLLEAVKTNNYLLYVASIHEMSSLFFSFDGQNYARYLTYFSVFLSNIDISHPGARKLIESGAFSVARSHVPGSRCDVDKTMEETFMKHAKSHGGAGSSGVGVSGLLSSYDAYQRWVRTTHARSLYVDAVLQTANMVSCENAATHRNLRPSELRRGERLVQKTKTAICHFVNPFDVDNKDQLVIVSSGYPATPVITHDVLNAEGIGEEARDKFIQMRLKTGTCFFEPVKRLKLKTLLDMKKVAKVTSSQNKVVQLKQQGNIAFHLLVKSQSQGLKLDLRELMTFPLTPVPYSLATPDGSFVKTDKAKGFHFLVKDSVNAALPPMGDTLTIFDGNASFYQLKDIPSNFCQIASKLFDMTGRSGDVIFSTDQYIPVRSNHHPLFKYQNPVNRHNQ